MTMDRADYWTTVRRQDESLAETIKAVRAALDAAELPKWQPGAPLAVVGMPIFPASVENGSSDTHTKFTGPLLGCNSR